MEKSSVETAPFLIVALLASTIDMPVVAQSFRATYNYDPRGRLTSVTSENLNAGGAVVGAARSITFSYDIASNRTAVVSRAPTAGNHAPFAGDDTYVAIPEVLLELYGLRHALGRRFGPCPAASMLHDVPVATQAALADLYALMDRPRDAARRAALADRLRSPR